MLKETVGALGAATLAAGLFGAPATASGPRTSAGLAGTAAADPKELDLNFQVAPDFSGKGNTGIAVLVTDEDGKAVEGLRVCLQHKPGLVWTKRKCGFTGKFGLAIFEVPTESKLYRIHIKETKKYQELTSPEFSADVPKKDQALKGLTGAGGGGIRR